MKKTLALLTVVLAVGMTAAFDAEAARRLGGGKSTGMQRQTTTQPAGPANGAPGQGAPAQSAAAAPSNAAAAGGAAAAAPKRNWMGPLAGLAAGLGLAALASHFGFGEALANMMMIGLLVMAVLLVVGIVMRKRAQGRNPALAAAGGPSGLGGGGFGRPQDATYRTNEAAPQQPAQGGSLIGSRIGGGIASAAVASHAGNVPAGFDVPAFERNAKDQFMALQAANDARDLDRLRDYLTPELFEDVRADIAARDATPQSTEVFGLQAQVLDVAEEADRYVVSVRFTGSVREQRGAVPEDLRETWHLAKPRTGFGGWLVAGIQQDDAAPQAH
ncbi:MAG: Tim44 domain-containing protein [Comamonadaceae bacterium]|nr:MAG: Tim44 domain-containing protein [Comamonadaceae bacterium]